MRVHGVVRVPGDKSISHRALLFAALGDGASRLRGLLDSADVNSTAGVLRAMGIDVPAIGPEITVDGRGLRGLRAPSGDLDCGNSGTTTRLVAGLVAASRFDARFVGDASLSRRPMRRIAKPLEAMGARVALGPSGGLPMTVHGAALVAGTRSSVREPVRSRDHTERMLAARGVPLRVDATVVSIDPTTRMDAVDVDVPGDPSSAAFFAGLAAMADEGELRLPGVCVNPTRTGFLEALVEMGAVVEHAERTDQGGEPTATLVVRAGGLRGITISEERVPSLIDELPLLSCLGAVAEGETLVTGASELRVKESDRIAAVVQNLRALGAEVDELPDGLRVVGSTRPLRGHVTTHGDHRLAMAFGVLGAHPRNEITVDDPECVGVSYPRFWTDLAASTGGAVSAGRP